MLWLHLAAPSSSATPVWLVLTYYVSAVTVALASIIFAFWKFVIPVFKFLYRFKNDWDGEPAREEDGFPGRPGAMKRLSTIEYKVDGIQAELHPNHGAPSMREQVNELWERSNEK